MSKTFDAFLEQYVQIWKTSSFRELKEIISVDFQGREIVNGEGIDFRFEHSLAGWSQGFQYVLENDGEWNIRVLSTIPLREEENLAIIFATMTIHDTPLTTGNLFFQTFQKDDKKEWKLIRSYIEAGVPIENINAYLKRRLK